MEESRLISPERALEDHPEKSLRPKNLTDFIGQKTVRENLKIFIESAKSRPEPMDHVLFFGPPGLGKTTLSQIIATELGVGFRGTSGPVISKAGDLAAILTNLQPNDVLFIDEIHRLNPVIEEVLYPAMEDYKIDLIIGEGPAARSIQIDLPPFTLVAATTRTGLLTSPLRDRFGIPLRLEFYTTEELAQVIERGARLLTLSMEPEAITEVARRSRGTPRIAGRLLRRVRDFACVARAKIVTQTLAHQALTSLGVDDAGLDSQDRRYLETIANAYGGGPVGAETLSAALSEQKDTLEEVIEPFLIQQGYIQRTPRGRMMTALSYQHLGLKKPSQMTLQGTKTPASGGDLFDNTQPQRTPTL